MEQRCFVEVSYLNIPVVSLEGPTSNIVAAFPRMRLDAELSHATRRRPAYNQGLGGVRDFNAGLNFYEHIHVVLEPATAHVHVVVKSWWKRARRALLRLDFDTQPVDDEVVIVNLSPVVVSEWGVHRDEVVLSEPLCKQQFTVLSSCVGDNIVSRFCGRSIVRALLLRVVVDEIAVASSLRADAVVPRERDKIGLTSDEVFFWKVRNAHTLSATATLHCFLGRHGRPGSPR